MGGNGGRERRRQPSADDCVKVTSHSLQTAAARGGQDFIVKVHASFTWF